MEARAAALGCSAALGPLLSWALLGLGGVVMATVAITAMRARVPTDDVDPVAMREGFLLGALSVVAAVMVGLPALLAQPC